MLDYEKIKKQWKNYFRLYIKMGLLVFFISIFIPLLFWIFNIKFPLNFEDSQKTNSDDLLGWIITGIVIAIVGFMVILKAFTFKNKISKSFYRRRIEENPSYMVDFYQVLSDFRGYLKNKNIEYSFKTKTMSGRISEIEFYFVGKPYSIFIEPIYSGEAMMFWGVTVSIGRYVDINSIEVQNLILLIENALKPNPI